MTESEAITLQVWCIHNLKANLVLKEQEGSAWYVVVGLPDGTRHRLDETFPMLAAFDPDTASPHPAVLGLGGFFKDYQSPYVRICTVTVHRKSLTPGAYPVIYDALGSKKVLVFSKP